MPCDIEQYEQDKQGVAGSAVAEYVLRFPWALSEWVIDDDGVDRGVGTWVDVLWCAVAGVGGHGITTNATTTKQMNVTTAHNTFKNSNTIISHISFFEKLPIW